MGTASKVAGQTMLQGKLGSQHRAAYSAGGACHQSLAPGQPHAPQGGGVERIVVKAGDVIRGMGQGKQLPAAALRAMQVAVMQQGAGAQVVVQALELFHRKPMGGREGKTIVLMVDQREIHGLSGGRHELASMRSPSLPGKSRHSPVVLLRDNPG